MLHHMLMHIGGWTGHRAEIVIAGTDPQKRRKNICNVHQEVADEDAFNGLEFGQDLLLKRIITNLLSLLQCICICITFNRWFQQVPTGSTSWHLRPQHSYDHP